MEDIFKKYFFLIEQEIDCQDGFQKQSKLTSSFRSFFLAE